MPEAGDALSVEVVYALAEGAPFLCRLDLPPGSTVADAVRASGLESAHPHVAWREPGNLGIFGERVAPDRTLRSGDRVEVYRALRIHPMQARRARAARGRAR